MASDYIDERVVGLLQESRGQAQKLLTLMEHEPIEQRQSRFPYCIRDFDLASILEKSESVLPGFATLDISLATAVIKASADLQSYQHDETRRRPHNLLMLAQPGSGKSNLVDCLAKSLKIPRVVGNLSALDSSSVMSYVVNEARNFKAQDIVPLLFLDEVDSPPLHYAALLPLLWDGEWFSSGQVLKLGRCIIVCAANKVNLEPFLDSEPNAHLKTVDSSKLPDFLSRFDAGILELKSINDEGRDLDKFCVAATLIKRRFPHADYVSLGILQFFSQVRVEHEIRSLEFLVNLIPATSVHALPSNILTGSPFKPDQGFLSLHQTWNKGLRSRFKSLLQGEGELTNLLRFHISEQDRRHAQELWSLYADNIGLLKLSYD